jgi:hypothetical protein
MLRRITKHLGRETMRPVRTEATNTNLTLPGGTADNDLPAEQCTGLLPDGITAVPMFETVWMPDEAETTRLAAGAPIILHVHGTTHPPVSVFVAEGVIDGHAKLDAAHIERAATLLYSALRERIVKALISFSDGNYVHAEAALPDPSEYAAMWTEALQVTA